MVLLESIGGLRWCSGVVGIDRRREVRFDWRRCDSSGSSAIQVSPDLSLGGWVGFCMCVRGIGVEWLRFGLMGFGGGMNVWVLAVVLMLVDSGFGFLMVTWVVVGVVWEVVIAAWAAVVAVQFDFGAENVIPNPRVRGGVGMGLF